MYLNVLQYIDELLFINDCLSRHFLSPLSLFPSQVGKSKAVFGSSFICDSIENAKKVGSGQL